MHHVIPSAYEDLFYRFGSYVSIPERYASCHSEHSEESFPGEKIDSSLCEAYKISEKDCSEQLQSRSLTIRGAIQKVPILLSKAETRLETAWFLLQNKPEFQVVSGGVSGDGSDTVKLS